MTEPPPPPGQPPWGPPPPGQPPWGPPPPGQPPWGPPPPQSSGALAITMGALTGTFAVFLSAILTFTMLYSSGGSVALKVFGIPVTLVLIGIALAVPAATRRFGLPFLIAVSVGFILTAGLCGPLLVGG